MTLWQEIIQVIDPYLGQEINQDIIKTFEDAVDKALSKYELDKDFKLFIKFSNDGGLQITPRIGITEKILDTDISRLKRKK